MRRWHSEGDLSEGRSVEQVIELQDRERIHDLPIGDSRVELTVRTLQYRCPPVSG